MEAQTPSIVKYENITYNNEIYILEKKRQSYLSMNNKVDYKSNIDALFKKIHVEQFSLITNWRVAERLLYNQDSKKDPPGIRKEEK